MQSVSILAQQFDFNYENIISRRVVEIPRIFNTYDFSQNLQITNAYASYSLILVPFSGLDKEIKRIQKMFKDGKHVDIVESVDDCIFKGFDFLAKMLHLDLQDKTQIPYVVTRLKVTDLIDEETSIQILDGLLILDGLISQVNQGESLSKRDLAFLTRFSKMFSEMKIVTSSGAAPAYRENWESSNYFSVSQLRSSNSTDSEYHYRTFSTSSNTWTQSSTTAFM